MTSYKPDDIPCSSNQHLTSENIQYVNLSTLNQAMETNIVHEAQSMTDLLNEMRSLKLELKKRDEASQKLISTLTAEVIALRNDVRKLNSHHFDVESTLLPALPFTSLSEFKEFDGKILIEDDMRAELKHVIQRVGGRDMASFLKMAIRALISDELAIDLTWRGTADKPSIQQFNSFNIIKDICVSKFKTATVFDINKVSQQHFLHAKDRVNKRQRKN